jgi:hypothetical protein
LSQDPEHHDVLDHRLSPKLRVECSR